MLIVGVYEAVCSTKLPLLSVSTCNTSFQQACQTEPLMLNRTIHLSLAMLATGAALLSGCGGSSSGAASPPDPIEPPTGLSSGPADCVAGNAGDFNCSNVALLSRVPLDALGGGNGNDLWGWVDEETGKEYALMGMSNGTAFVDVTDPQNPGFLGTLPTQTVDSPWRDIKVYLNHAYVVADGAGAHGMQVFDLTRLRDTNSPQTFAPDVVYGDFGNAHNLAINETTGFAYAVGTNTCDEGLHIIDISTPVNPTFIGCHSAYHTHDTQCVSYVGPDSDYSGREICASSAGDRMEIADLTDKGAPGTVSTTTYPQLGFVHQAWLSEDHRFLFIGDELDETTFDVPTRTHIVDVTDLDSPVYLYAYEGTTTAIDHNLYVLGNRLFEANYTSGLRVIEFGNPANAELSEIAYFDTLPEKDGAEFDGAWSLYPFLPSGTILVSDMSNGLFLLALEALE